MWEGERERYEETRYAVHRVVKIPVHLEIQQKYILEYIASVTVIYFVCNLAVALTAIGSQIRTAFKLDSGLLDCSAPSRLKKAERLTFFICLRRKGFFYSKIYASRFVISVLVMVVSAVCLRLFIEEKKEYEYLMGAIEHAYDYQADDPAEGLTDRSGSLICIRSETAARLCGRMSARLT